MLWQAVDDLHFRLAGGALKTPNATGGPVNQGAPGSARRILADLTIYGGPEPTGSPTQYATIRAALRAWHVDEVVIDGKSRDPVYASGYLTAALGMVPSFSDFAWVWKIPPQAALPPANGRVALAECRYAAAEQGQKQHPLAMAHCVLPATPAS
jgi:hypothetical protein